MGKTVLKPEAMSRLKAIHRLSQEVNGKLSSAHNKKLLKLMGHHVREIAELFQKGSKHYLIETGDLAILCFEVLLENHTPIDDTMRKCFQRYESKLTQLIKQRKENGTGRKKLCKKK